MMRLTFLMLLGNAIFYLIQAVSCCRILTRRFSWPVMVLGFAVGYLLFVTPAIPCPETGMIRGVIALVSFPLVDMVLFRDKWYRCLFCGVAAVLIMSAADMISAAVLLTPEQLRQGLTFQPIPVQLTSYAIFLSASAFFLWMFTLLMNRYKYRLSGREWALYLLFPVSQCLLLYGWMMLCRLDFSANRMWILLAGLITCVAADAALFTAVRGMAQRVELQAENDLPIVGVVEPTCRRALLVTKNKKVGIIATLASIRSGAYEAMLRRLDPAVEIIGKPCPLFVPLVENGRISRGDVVIETVAREYLEPLKATGVDTLILGCTHYPLLTEIIGDIMGPEVTLVSAGEESAFELKRLLKAGSLRADEGQTGGVDFYVSDRPEDFEKIASVFLGTELSHGAERINIEQY